MTEELAVYETSTIMVVIRDESQPRLMAFNDVLPDADPRTTPHGDIMAAVARYMDVPDSFLTGHYVQPHGTNFTIMPKPEFGIGICGACKKEYPESQLLADMGVFGCGEGQVGDDAKSLICWKCVERAARRELGKPDVG